MDTSYNSGDVQQAFNTGDPIKRGQPQFVRMPPDGVPGESREVWVQLLKKVNGLADGTRWRNCSLATARGVGFETSVLEPCVLVLRGSQQRYHGTIGLANGDIAGGGHDVWEQTISELKKRLTFGRWEVGKEKILWQRGCTSSRWIHACWTTCLFQESGFCASRNNEESSWVFST